MSTPSYYQGKYKGIEAMDVVLDFQEDSYNLGVAISYLLRAGKKPGNPKSQDIRKAIAHLKSELKHLENNASRTSTANGMELLYTASNKG